MPNTGHSHLGNDLSSRTGPHEEHTNMRIQPKPSTPGLLCRFFWAYYDFLGKDITYHPNGITEVPTSLGTQLDILQTITVDGQTPT